MTKDLSYPCHLNINKEAMDDYRILVVDDEEDLCEILKFNLENEGYIYMLSKKGAFVSEKSYDNQNEILNELKTVFMKAKDMGVKYDEIVDTVNEVFKC